MIDRIEHKGKLVHDCDIPGETRADDVFPAHPNGIQIAEDRFLLLIATRGWRGTDDDLSIVAQLRKDAYDGPVIRDVMLSKSVDDWDGRGDGTPLVRQHGHPVAFGVPKGALIDGRPAPNADVFVIKWRVVGRFVDPDTGLMTHGPDRPELKRSTQGVEWMQVRLNDAGDDLEILQPTQSLRQVGFEDGSAFCEIDAGRMNQSFTQPVPFTRDGLEWADVNHFSRGLAALRYRFNPDKGLYEWVQTGPLISPSPDRRLAEAALAPCGDGWAISARSDPGIAWMRTTDLFGEVPTVAAPPEPNINSPQTVYACPDGALRLLTGDPDISPYHNGRDPLYLWDVDPDAGFAVSNRRVVFDCVKADVGIPLAQVPRVDMAKLLPHAGGRRQILIHRVRTKATNDPRKTGTPASPAEKDASGIYWAYVEYSEDLPGVWEFGKTD